MNGPPAWNPVGSTGMVSTYVGGGSDEDPLIAKDAMNGAQPQGIATRTTTRTKAADEWATCLESRRIDGHGFNVSVGGGSDEDPLIAKDAMNGAQPHGIATRTKARR